MGLHNAYAIEVVIVVWALLTIFYIVWMIRKVWQDYWNSVVEKHPPAWQITGFGRIVAECWRLSHTVCLLWIGLYMLTHPPPTEAGDFFSADQFSPGRVLILILTMSKGMASFTDHWYRRKARIANGIRNP